VIELVVPPFDHVYVPAQAEAVKVADVPVQIETPPPVTVKALGIAFTTTFTVARFAPAVSQLVKVFLQPTL
jgi:hypothetical protein